jgi:hypothetical protein
MLPKQKLAMVHPGHLRLLVANAGLSFLWSK